MGEGDPGRRRNIWMPDELWAAVVDAAARETLDSGDQVSASEWIREAVRQRLEDTATD